MFKTQGGDTIKSVFIVSPLVHLFNLQRFFHRRGVQKLNLSVEEFEKEMPISSLC